MDTLKLKLKLVELVEQRYENAIQEMEEILVYGSQTPQARSARRLSEGAQPQRNKNVIRIKDELIQERRMVLKGILATVDFIKQQDGRITATELIELIGDVDGALDRRLRQDNENE